MCVRVCACSICTHVDSVEGSVLVGPADLQDLRDVAVVPHELEQERVDLEQHDMHECVSQRDFARVRVWMCVCEWSTCACGCLF